MDEFDESNNSADITNAEVDNDIANESSDIAIGNEVDIQDAETQGLDDFAKYYGDHNYGPEDYSTYSQDPEWRDLMQENYPDVELPPLEGVEIGSEAESKALNDFAHYYDSHGYGPEDYDIYSQDDEWRNMMQKTYPDTELPPKK